MTESDARLWRRWLERRDEAAYTTLVRRHGAFAFDFAARLAGNPADAEDLTQEAFLELAGDASERPADVGLRAFLGRRMVLAARTSSRQQRSRRRRERRAARRLAREEDPAARLDAAAALDALTEEQRTVLALRFLHGLSYSEIAYALGLTEPAARMRVHRALRTSRSRLRTAALLALPAQEASARSGGALLMGWNTKQVVVVLLLVAAGLTLATWPERDDPRPDAARAPRMSPMPPVANPPKGRTPADGAREPAAVRGVLRYADGAPVTALRVGMAHDGRCGVTDSAGRFVLDGFLPGHKEQALAESAASSRIADLLERKRAHDTLHFRVVGDDGGWVTVGETEPGARAELVIERGWTMTGSVRAEGLWLEDVVVRLRRRGRDGPVQARSALARTDAEGRFRFELLLPGRYDLRVAERGRHAPYEATVEIEDRPVEHDVELAPARDWTIRFENLPPSMDDAEVWVRLLTGPWPEGRQ